MRTLARFGVLTFLALSAAPPAWAMATRGASAGRGGASAFFGPVTQPWAQAVIAFYRGPYLSLEGLNIVLIRLGSVTLDPEDEESRLVLGPIVSQLAALGYNPQRFLALDPLTRRLIMNLAAGHAVAAVKSLDRELSNAAERGDSEASASRETLRGVFGEYLRTSLPEGAEVAANMRRTAEALGQPKEEVAVSASPSPAATDAGLTIARRRISELHSSMDHGYNRALVLQLQTQAAAPDATEELQRVIVVGLIRESAGSFDHNYLRDVWKAIEAIAKGSPFLSVKGDAISGSLSEIDGSFDHNYRAYLQEVVDRIGVSAGGLSKIPIPPFPGKGSVSLEASQGFFKKFSEGVQEHPWGAFFGLLVITVALTTMAMAHFHPVGIAAVAALLLYVGVMGLSLDSPRANFFQLLLIGALFENVAVGAGGALSGGLIVGTVVAGSVLSAVAIWSFMKEHPWLGFFVNLLLVGMFEKVMLNMNLIEQINRLGEMIPR